MAQDRCLPCEGVKKFKKFGYAHTGFVNESPDKHFLSFSEIRPNAKGHVSIVTKRHIKDIREMTPEEWSDLLPILKDTIRKIDKVYKPVGFYSAIPIGKLASQNASHFYMRVVPKYKKGYGQMRIKEQIKEMSPQEYQEAAELLQAQDGIVGKKNKCVANLDKNGDWGWEANPVKNRGRIEISPQTIIPNDSNYVLEKLDQETWNQMGELMQECIKLMEQKINCNNFSISICIGKMTGTDEKDEPTLKLRVRPVFSKNFLEPIGRPVIDGHLAGTMDNERIAEKLRDPEAYYWKWNKVPRAQLESQLDKNKTEKSYWIVGCGILLFFFSYLSY